MFRKRFTKEFSPVQLEHSWEGKLYCLTMADGTEFIVTGETLEGIYEDKRNGFRVVQIRTLILDNTDERMNFSIEVTICLDKICYSYEVIRLWKK